MKVVLDFWGFKKEMEVSNLEMFNGTIEVFPEMEQNEYPLIYPSEYFMYPHLQPLVFKYHHRDKNAVVFKIDCEASHLLRTL